MRESYEVMCFIFPLSSQQMLSMAATANSSQRPPAAIVPNSSPAHAPVTTPTQVTPVSSRKRGRPPASDNDDR